MDFDEGPSEAAFRARVRAWLVDNCPPRTEAPLEPLTSQTDVGSLDRAKALQAQLADAGFAGITWPAEHGGQGGPVMEQLIFDEEAAQFDLPLSAFIVGVTLAGPTIISHGTEVQKARYLDPMLRGEEVWCQLFSEPDAGSDLASMRSRAHLDGDHWVVTGQKVWSSGAHYSDFGIMPVRTDPAQPKHKGLTYFILDMRSPGITVRPLRQMTGDSHFNEVFLDEVRVPVDNVIGEVGDGWRVTRTTLMHERTGIGAGFMVELAPLIAAAEQAASDQRAGIDNAAVRLALVDVHIQAEILRLLKYRILTALSQGQIPGPEASMAKLVMGQQVRSACDLALMLQGARGMLIGPTAPIGGSWQNLFLFGPAVRIAGGSDEIQRNILGERALGLPRDPDPTRDLAFSDATG